MCLCLLENLTQKMYVKHFTENADGKLIGEEYYFIHGSKIFLPLNKAVKSYHPRSTTKLSKPSQNSK